MFANFNFMVRNASLLLMQTMLFFACFLGLQVQAAIITFSEPAVISATDFTYDNNDIVIDGVTVYIDGEHEFVSLKVVNGGVLTHSVEQKLSLEIAGSVEVDSTSMIDVSGKGLLSGLNSGFQGGSHGGRGGGDSGLVYGSFKQPETLGQGGGGLTDKRGGGAIKISTTNLLLEGRILATGDHADSANYSGGGAGGSVWLDVDAIVFGAVTGDIQVNGGDNHDYVGSGGGGGRVALYYRSLTGFTYSRIKAKGGSKTYLNWGAEHGAPGTIYIEDETGVAHDALYIIGNSAGSRYQITDISSVGDEALHVENASVRLVGAEHSFNSSITMLGGNLIVDGSAIFSNVLSLQASDISVQNNAVFTENALVDAADASSLTINGQLRVPNDALIIDGFTLSLAQDHTFSSINIGSGGVLTTPIATEEHENSIAFTAATITVQEGGRIDVSGKGWDEDPTADPNTGGSHGGRGGSYSGGQAGPVYGLEQEPESVGAGGRFSSALGGGAIRLIADTLRLNGSILANGMSVVGIDYSEGAAAGGSIWLNVGELISDNEIGEIRADGSEGSRYYGDGDGDGSGGGGGGRIAIYYESLAVPEINITARGGIGTSPDSGNGEAGTVFKKITVTPFIHEVDVPSLSTQSVSNINVEFNIPIDAITISVADVSVVNALQQTITPASVTAVSDKVYRLNFTVPLGEGSYTLTVGPNIVAQNGLPMDQNRNGTGGEMDDAYTFAFEIDLIEPVTVSVDVPVAPVVNKSTTTAFVLSGSREANTAIRVNGTQVVPLGSGNWNATIALPQGLSTLTVVAVDAAGNTSVPVTVLVDVDSIRPSLQSIIPLNGAVLAGAPSSVELNFAETGGGLNLSVSALTITRNTVAISGTLSLNGNQLRFTPANPFIEGSYTVVPTLVDNHGNTSTPATYTFVVDYTPPPAPVLNDYPSLTSINTQTFSGTKEAGSHIVRNGQQVVGATSSTSWSYAQSLAFGDNTFSFTAQDAAGNESPAVAATIRYDDQAPGPVSITVNPNGSGTELTLSWSGYNEVTNGNDIATYRVYAATQGYTSVTGLTPVREIAAGTRSATITGLTRATAYYVSVVAVDRQGLLISEVTPVVATPVDTKAPAEITRLQVTTGPDSIGLSWLPSANTDGDLAAYRLRYTAEGETQTVTLNQTDIGTTSPITYTLTGLAPATAHNVTVVVVDNTGNASTGLGNPAATWLPNPPNLQAEGFSGRAELSWSAVSPHALIKHYAVYVQPASFTSVAGLTPTLILPKGSASQSTVQGAVAGLTDGVTVYVAVTAVNVSNGEAPTVTPVSVTPQADTEGPVISAATFTGNGTTIDLTTSPTLTHSGVVAVTATDKSALSRVVPTLNDQPLANLTNGAGGSYTHALDLARYADGAHTLGVAVYDTLDNVTEADYPFTLALAAPATPAITTPAASQLTNQPSLTVSGTTSPNTRVQILNNGVVVADNLVPDSEQRFSTTLTLAEGENTLVAQARYADRTTWSDNSASRVITLNTEIPDAPTGVTATAAQQGQVYLGWNAVTSSNGATPVKGYRVYRAPTPFTSTTEAGVQLVNTSLLTATTYTDLVVTDGAYVYAVTAVNQANNESALSARVSATVDSTGPKALSVTYTSNGPVDTASGRMAPGIVQLVVQFDEPLRNKPYFALVPNGGVPIPVELTKDYSDDQRYTGQLAITEATPSGQAYVVMSAHDNAGNRGTEVLDGASVLIDTDGPDATALALNPADPLKVDAVNGLSVDVALTLNDELPGSEQPVLIPLLDGEALAGYEAGLSLARDGPSPEGSPLWLGTLVLPVSAGQDENGQPTVATLSFSYRARDDLNNLSTRIQGLSSFQVYQGDLPPLNVPLNLTARARAHGQVALSWDAVNAAAGYVVYRQGPTDTELVALDMPDLLTATAYTDTTPVDGTYVYAVTSVRRENQQEAESARSDSVSVQTDRVAPGAPQALALELNGAGLVARWAAPTQDASGNPQNLQGVTYNLYRLDRPEGQQVTDLTGLTPLQTGIPALIALDTTPSETEHSYLLTAVDAADNESAPSTTEYLNFGLLPVSHLTLVHSHQGFPQLSWRHNGQAISHYRVYRHQGEDEPVLIADDVPHAGATTIYTDTGYNQAQASDGAGTAVVYSVVAVDDNAVESLGHDLPLSALAATLADADTHLARGVMNRTLFRVDNRGDAPVSGLRLVVTLTVEGVVKEHTSEVFAVEAGAFTPVPVVIGGYADLDGLADLQLRLDYTPQPNDRVTIHQAATVPVTSASLLADLATEDFVRGGSGTASFTLENTSAVETEIVMASSNGNAASPEVRLVLEDLQGNVLSVQPVKQYTGGVVTLSNGRTVARLAPGETFTSAPVEIPVPEAAPDQVRLRLVIDRFHYQLGRDTQVAIEGVGARRELMLSETPYTAELTGVTPAVLYGPNEQVTLTGRALDRASGQPLAQVPVNLVLTVRGFETRVTVYTDAEGNFSHVYAPQGTSGTYRISALHPDARERPTHGEFRVEGGSVAPTELRVNIPRNYTQTIPLRVNAGYDSVLGNVRLTLLGQDANSTPQLPLGINVSHDPVTAIKAQATGYLNLRFNGDNSADTTGSLRYRVEADNFTGARALGEVTLHYTLSEAAPAVSASPTYIETGVGLDEQVVENLTVTNKGLETLHNAQVSLVMRTGNDPAPSWVRLGTAPALGNLAVGESRPVQVIASPPTGVTEDDYEFALRITGDNLAIPFTIPVFIAVTQSGQGHVLFRVADIYTATLDENNQLIPGLAGARIRLQNENVLTQTFDLSSNAEGEALFEGLPAGRYAYRASAFDHSSVSGRVWIKPGVTATEDVFLMNSLVTVEWSVREITIEDRYEIKLDATFETHVPVALVMFSPLNVQLPVMKQGDLFHGELTLTNHGLIRATDVQSRLPQGNDLARIEFLREIPTTLEAGEVFTLPYRIQALRDFNPAADANATGGGCGSFNAQARVNYQSQCANGTVVPGGTSANWNSNWGSNCGGNGGSSGGGGSGSYYYGGGGGGGGSSYVPRGGALGESATNQCAAPPYCEECNKDNGAGD